MDELFVQSILKKFVFSITLRASALLPNTGSTTFLERASWDPLRNVNYTAEKRTTSRKINANSGRLRNCPWEMGKKIKKKKQIKEREAESGRGWKNQAQQAKGMWWVGLKPHSGEHTLRPAPTGIPSSKDSSTCPWGLQNKNRGACPERQSPCFELVGLGCQNKILQTENLK